MAAPSSWEDYLVTWHDAIPMKPWGTRFELLDVLVMEERSLLSWLRRLRLRRRRRRLQQLGGEMEKMLRLEKATRAGSLLRRKGFDAARDEYARFKLNARHEYARVKLNRRRDMASGSRPGPAADKLSQANIGYDDLHDGSRINLKSAMLGTYVCAENGAVLLNRTEAQNLETFKIWKHSSRPGIYALRADNNRFLSVSADGVLSATAIEPQESEYFTFTRNPYNTMQVHIEAYNGRLLQVKNCAEIKADGRKKIHGKAHWEANKATFEIAVLEPEEIDDLLDGSQIQLKSVTHGTFVWAEEGQVMADRRSAGRRGTFKIWKHSNATVYGFQSFTGKFLSVANDGHIVCVTTSEPREAEWFTIRKNPNNGKQVHIRAHHGGFLQATSRKQVTTDYKQVTWKPCWEDKYVAFRMTVSEPKEIQTEATADIQPVAALIDHEFQWFSKADLPDIDADCSSSTHLSATLHEISTSVSDGLDAKGSFNLQGCHVTHIKSHQINMEKLRLVEACDIPSEWLKGFRAPAIWIITEILYTRRIEVVVTKLQGNVADPFEYKGLDVHVNRDGKVVLWTNSEPSYFPFAFKVLRLDHDKKESIKFRTRQSNSDN